MDDLIRKVTGVMMVAAGGFFVVVAILAIVGLPGTVRLLQEAPFITDGVLDPANEGKVVVLSLHIEDVGDAADDELGLSFSYPCVIRDVERLTCTLSNQKWEWRRIRDTDDQFGSKTFFGDASVGDYQIEGDLLRGLAQYTDLTPSDFDAAELNRLLETYDGLTTEYWDDRFYFTNTYSIYFDDFEYDGHDTSTRRHYRSQEGALRFRYRGLPRDAYSRIVVLGRQEGNWIVEDERVDTLTVFDGIEDTDALVRSVIFHVLGGIVLAMLVCVPLIIFGIRRIVYDW